MSVVLFSAGLDSAVLVAYAVRESAGAAVQPVYVRAGLAWAAVGLKAPHPDRPFTDHVRATQPDWRLVERVPNSHTWDGDVSCSTRSDFFVYERGDSPG